MTVLHELPCRPDVAAMTEMVQALFARADRGKIELAWTSPQIPHRLTGARMFDVSELDALVRHAAQMNAAVNRNVYVSAGLRRNDVALDRRAGVSDVIAVTALKIDCDDPGCIETALQISEALGIEPTYAMYTGQEPYRRGSLWWVLETPCDELDRVKRIEQALAAKFGSDPSVAEVSRVMRLAGSVAWPLKRDQGRVLEMTGAIDASVRVAPYRLDEIENALQSAGAMPLPPHTATILDFSKATRAFDYDGLIECAAQPSQWHASARELVSSLWSRGTPGDVILDTLTGPLTQPGYTWQQTRQDLTVLIRGCAKWKQPELEAVNEGWAQPETKTASPSPALLTSRPPLAGHTFDGVLPSPRPWVYGRMLMKRALTVIAAPPGVGKTTFSLQLAVRYAMGQGWLGFEPRHCGPVVVVNGEEPIEEMMRRFLAACVEAKIDPADAAPGVTMVSGFDQQIRLVRHDRRTGQVARTPDIDDLKAIIRAKGATLAILDPLVDLHGVEEKDNTALSEFTQVLREIARDCDISILAFSHVPKSTNGDESAGDLNAIRGGGAIGGAARIAYTMFSMSEKDAEDMGIEPEHRSEYVRLDAAKASMSKRVIEPIWFRQSAVSLENGVDDAPPDMVGVLTQVELNDNEARAALLTFCLQCDGDSRKSIATAYAKQCGISYKTIEKHLDDSIPVEPRNLNFNGFYLTWRVEDRPNKAVVKRLSVATPDEAS